MLIWIAGFMTTDLGLSLALQRERASGRSVATNTQTTRECPNLRDRRSSMDSRVSSTALRINTVRGENNIGESDTEREREVERLSWTSNVPAASLSSSRTIPPRHDFPSKPEYHILIGIVFMSFRSCRTGAEGNSNAKFRTVPYL